MHHYMSLWYLLNVGIYTLSCWPLSSILVGTPHLWLQEPILIMETKIQISQNTTEVKVMRNTTRKSDTEWIPIGFKNKNPESDLRFNAER